MELIEIFIDYVTMQCALNKSVSLKQLCFLVVSVVVLLHGDGFM